MRRGCGNMKPRTETVVLFVLALLAIAVVLLAD